VTTRELAKMSPRIAKLLRCIAAIILCCNLTIAQDVNHGWRRDPPLGVLSRYNTITKHFEPVSA
jgi:hypothetical protein